MPVELVASGPVRKIAFAVCTNGDLLAKAFPLTLSDSDSRKLRALFQRTVDCGEIRNEQKFKHEQGKIWAFKSHQIRIGCFRIQDCWYLTHGFIKKGDRWPKAEMTRAERVMSEHLRFFGER